MINPGNMANTFPKARGFKVEDECMHERRKVFGVKTQNVPSFNNLPPDFCTPPAETEFVAGSMRFPSKTENTMYKNVNQSLTTWQRTHVPSNNLPTIADVFRHTTHAQAGNSFYNKGNMYETEKEFYHNAESSFQDENNTVHPDAINLCEGEKKQMFEEVDILQEVSVSNSKKNNYVASSQTDAMISKSDEQKHITRELINQWTGKMPIQCNVKLENSPCKGEQKYITQELIYDQNILKRQNCNMFDDVQILREVCLSSSGNRNIYGYPQTNVNVLKASEHEFKTQEFMHRWNTNLSRPDRLKLKSSPHKEPHVTQELVCDNSMFEDKDVQILRNASISRSMTDSFTVPSETNVIVPVGAEEQKHVTQELVNLWSGNLSNRDEIKHLHSLQEEVMLDNNYENEEQLTEHKDLGIFYFEGAPDQERSNPRNTEGDKVRLSHIDNVQKINPEAEWHSDRPIFSPQINASPQSLDFPSGEIQSPRFPELNLLSYPQDPPSTSQSLRDQLPGFHPMVKNSNYKCSSLPNFNRHLPQNYSNSTKEINNSLRFRQAFLSGGSQGMKNMFSPSSSTQTSQQEACPQEHIFPRGPQEPFETYIHCNVNNDRSLPSASNMNLLHVNGEALLQGNTNSLSNTNSQPLPPAREESLLEVNGEFVSKNKSHTCPFCQNQLKSKRTLQTHIMRHHRQIKCPHCFYAFFDVKQLKRHLVAHSDDTPFACTQCPKMYKQKEELTTHVQQCHPKTRQFLCGHCPATFKVRKALRNHMLGHNDERPYVCLKCPAAYKNPNSLRHHCKKHSDDKPYSCKQCPAKFKWHSNLSQHEATHGERKLECAHCLARFRHKNNLRAHIKIHMGVKQHACTKCPAKFRELSTLKIHLKAHLNDKKFTCSQCSEGFRYKGHLQKHLQNCCDKQLDG